MFKFFLFFPFITQTVFAKDFTKPTSIALRTEVSYVSEVTLDAKKSTPTGKTQLSFSLIKNLHNESDKIINILVESKLAQNFALKTQYIIAYQKVRKSKVKGKVFYFPNTDGPFLLNVEGANPAIFRTNELLIKQFNSSPQMAQSNPQLLINNIFHGISEKDPKVKDFFIRELINWDALHKHLKQDHFQQLKENYNSMDASLGTMIAVLEPRPLFHQAIGKQNLTEKAINMLKYIPVDMDGTSQLPTLILQALRFVENDKQLNAEILSRWSRSNISTIAEQAILMLEKINPTKALNHAKDTVLNTHLNDTTRRTLMRFISAKERK